MTLAVPSAAFFNAAGRTGRDLAVLSCRVAGATSVLDALAGCGTRALRYASGAPAVARVAANEAEPEARAALRENLARGVPDGVEYSVTAEEVRSLLATPGERYGLVDVDAFGCDKHVLGLALSKVEHGGLAVLGAAESIKGSGRQPPNALAAYGCWATVHPAANEQALRMLLGGAGAEAAAQRLAVEPLFSYFAPNGMLRVCVRVVRGRTWPTREFARNLYGFLASCDVCGSTGVLSWERLGDGAYGACDACGAPAPRLSGPLWTGPLQDAAFLHALIEEASKVGWDDGELGGVLRTLRGEADDRFPPCFVRTTEVARRAGCPTPRLQDLLGALRADGYAAAATHIEPTGLRTDAPFETVCAKAVGLVR